MLAHMQGTNNFLEPLGGDEECSLPAMSLAHAGPGIRGGGGGMQMSEHGASTRTQKGAE